MEDIFGIKPIANTFEKASGSVIKGAESFCSKVFSPTLDEIGLLLENKAQAWRSKNIIKILEKSEGKLIYSNSNGKLTIHPRLLLNIIENGSLCEEDEFQEMWSGLLATSCLHEKSDENLIFINLLKQLTSVQAKILKYSCENSKKIIYENGLIGCDGDLNISCDNLIKLTGASDIHRLDRELDFLRSMELIHCGFVMGKKSDANISPTSLALNFFIKISGSNDSPELFYKESIKVVSSSK